MTAIVQLQVDVQALAFGVGIVIPALVALLTKLRASSGVKALVNAFLSAVAGAAVVAIQQSGVIDVGHVAIGIGEVWVTSIATYYGLLKPTGTTARIAAATARFGIGARRG